MSRNNQPHSVMSRFFEFVFNVPGDCFCCCWSISCFLETVEHMDGDKRWRSMCSIGMTSLSLIIALLLALALCPRFYWSEIHQHVLFNSTENIAHIDYSASTYVPTMYLNATQLNASATLSTNLLRAAPVDDMEHSDDDNEDDDSAAAYNLTVHTRTYQHIALSLNLWHINECTQNDTNRTFWKTFVNLTNSQKIGSKTFVNTTAFVTNPTCQYITYAQSGTQSSTQDLSLWFIFFVVALLVFAAVCILGTHPVFDACHRKNATMMSTTQKILGIATTILCACILNWSSFVFAAVFEAQIKKYAQWQEKVPTSQSNLGTGMLAVNAAMLLTIVLSVVHCGAPKRRSDGLDRLLPHLEQLQNGNEPRNEENQSQNMVAGVESVTVDITNNSLPHDEDDEKVWEPANIHTYASRSERSRIQVNEKVEESMEFKYQNMSMAKEPVHDDDDDK